MNISPKPGFMNEGLFVTPNCSTHRPFDVITEYFAGLKQRCNVI